MNSSALSFAALDVPEELSEKQKWLEQHLISVDFSSFVSELDLLIAAEIDSQKGFTTRLSLEEILGQDRNHLLENGLSSVNEEQLQQLLLSPNALVELNEEVFVFGGEYWNRQIQAEADNVNSGLSKLLSSTLKSINGQVLNESPDAGNSNSAETEVENTEEKVETLFDNPAKPKTFAKPLAALTPLFALVATVLLVVAGVWMFNRPGSDGGNTVAEKKGWERDDWFQNVSTDKEYMQRMIEGVQVAWQAESIDSAESYTANLKRVINGCGKMINSEHSLLSDSQREILVQKCKNWQQKFKEQLDLVTENPKDFVSIKKQTQETIDKTVAAIGKILDA